MYERCPCFSHTFLKKIHVWHSLHNLLTSVYDLQKLLSSSTKNRRT